MKKQMGILLDSYVLKRELLRSPIFEKVYLYEKYAKKLDIEPIYFPISGVDFNKKEVRGYVWNDKTGNFKRVKQPLPRVIHNRLLTGRPKINKKVRLLCEDPNIVVFNPLVNRNKLFLHEYLSEDEKLQPHLPETYPFSKEHFQKLKDEKYLFIKPATGSIGRGIFFLSKVADDKYRYISFTKRRGSLNSNDLFKKLSKYTKRRPYLIQKGIELARYHNLPFDLRVTVQKVKEKEWTVSGMVGKVAPAGSALTNIGRGGKAVPIDKVLKEAFPDREEHERNEIKEAVNHLSVSICKKLEKKWPGLADVGLDIGVDGKGKPWFIEANVRDQRYSFLSAGEKKLFRKTYRHPVEYAHYLLTQTDKKPIEKISPS